MQKVTTLILILCLLLSGAFCYASGAAGMENEKGEKIDIEVKEKTCHGGSDRGACITPSINGHVLTVTFSENLGQVSVEIATATGASVQCLSVLTPSGLQFYIPNAGDYIVNFTLPNGDEYYGEFEVTE